ncbi:MAG TPA: hypothetical protein VMZ71_09335 [Gemmataceae bacterium]|nr:hypothetical protein [Gemmataceae bacterium]
MQLFCPVCQAAFPAASRCPKCGGLLLMPQEAVESRPRFGAPPEEIRPTSLGRILVGTIITLGLYLALRKMANAWVLAHQVDPEAWWASADGLAAAFTAQGFAAVVGAVLAAAGRGGGFAVGAAVGSVCGGLFLAVELVTGATGRDIVFYLQPPILALAGGVAGAISTRIWIAPPLLDMPVPAAPPGSKLSSLQFSKEEIGEKGRPTEWVRILVGAGVIVIGFLAAEQVRYFAQKYSGGMLQVQSISQGEFMSWQLALLVILFGGGVAAAGTGAGIWHGALAGLLGGAAAVGLNAQRGGPNQPSTYWLEKLSLSGLPPLDTYVIIAIGGGVFLAAVVGGWLGGQLLPPLGPEQMRDRRFKLGNN